MSNRIGLTNLATVDKGKEKYLKRGDVMIAEHSNNDESEKLIAIVFLDSKIPRVAA